MGKKRIVASVMSVAMLCSLAACGGQSAQSSKTIEFWDPYPQYTAGTSWDKYVQTCKPDGYELKRVTYPQSDLLNNLTTAAKAGNAPQIALIDNPKMPSAVDAGLVTDIKAAGVDTTGFDENIEGPGIIDNTWYGLAYGVNTLGLYYNPEILSKAGVDPASITDWDSLNAALKKVTDAGFKGITFAGVSGEEGVFQFQPWFWGANGDMSDLKSQAYQDALDLVSGWIKNGYAPKSATTDNQSAAWDVFLTGEYAFAENGSWQELTAEKKGYKMIPIPAKDGGVAPVPTGGEFITMPIQKKEDKDKTAAAVKVIECLTGGDNLKKTADEIGYFAAKKDVRAEQEQENPVWEQWAKSVDAAQGRTTKMGLKYEDASAQVSEDLQNAMNQQ
ncbi:sugar ABC transporter substrate-binding protein [Bifidobacterium scaligerum]|uniref:ABC transporter substrate-binding protein n=1 Tax=Bifidobacterium scaligerum TaxID=2052656 RepID=A0A2M9HN76_9BIFI|nr:extracellular solute-binding protein [Bifidobacterium scaligerum]PJM78268.1 ABC transporter substrate-binding protein [Bifidobacterium scaligerum]